MATCVYVNGRSNQNQAQNFSLMSKKKRKYRNPGKPLRFRRDPVDKRVLILLNGTRIRQPIVGVGLYLSERKRVYTLTEIGLRHKRVNYWKKNHYLKRTRTGHRQGQIYPYVSFQGRTYRMHILMALAWKGGLPEGMVADHTNGDIDDFSAENIRIIDIPENIRCGGILRRLRNVAKERNDPSLLPVNIDNADLLEIFERTKCMQTTKNRRKRKAMFLREVERYRTLVTLRHASVQLHDPTINPDNMDAERRELVLSKYRVEDPNKRMEWEMTHHMEC